MNIEQSVKQFIEKNLVQKRQATIVTENESLLEKGLLDSTDIFELTAFIEREFGIEILDEEVVPEHFETINAVVTFVKGKLAV